MVGWPRSRPKERDMSIRSVVVVGTGAVGEALARNLVKHGLDVQIASRDAEKVRQLVSALGDHARAADIKALGKGVDAVFLAVPAGAAPSVLEDAGGLPDVVVVDCTNPITWDAGPVHAPPEE